MDFENSYCVMGPIAVGKTRFAEALSKKTGLPVISMEVFRDLPSMEQLVKYQNDMKTCPYPEHVLERYMNLREKYPNIKCFKDLGYKKEVKDELIQKYGNDAGDLYEKQFENLMMESITRTVEGKAIIDTMASAPISLSSFEQLQKQIMGREPDRFNKYFPDNNLINPIRTTRIYSLFKNRIGLQLPKKEQDYGFTAKKPDISKKNNRYLQTGQFDALSTIKVPTDGFYNNKGVNNSAINKQVDNVSKAAPIKTADVKENKEDKKEDKQKKTSKIARFFKGLLSVITFSWLFKLVFKRKNKNQTKENQSQAANDSQSNTENLEEAGLEECPVSTVEEEMDAQSNGEATQDQATENQENTASNDNDEVNEQENEGPEAEPGM